jgi:hypothetical protein
MSYLKQLCLLTVVCLLPIVGEGGDLTGRINTIAPILATQNQIYISMTGTTGNAIPDGLPGGSCSNTYAFADMANANFKSFVYPIILMAKAADAEITLRTSGCISGYPIIIGVDYTPR